MMHLLSLSFQHKAEFPVDSQEMLNQGKRQAVGFISAGQLWYDSHTLSETGIFWWHTVDCCGIEAWIHFLFGNNYRFIQTCKNSTERSHAHFTQFSPVVTPCITVMQYRNQEIDNDRIHRVYSDFTSFYKHSFVYVYRPMQFYHAGVPQSISRNIRWALRSCNWTKVSLILNEWITENTPCRVVSQSKLYLQQLRWSRVIT